MMRKVRFSLMWFVMIILLSTVAAMTAAEPRESSFPAQPGGQLVVELGTGGSIEVGADVAASTLERLIEGVGRHR